MKKLIPPFLFLLSTITMILLHLLAPFYVIFPYPLNLLGVFILLAGLAIGFSVMKQFRQVNTEIHTFKKPRKLVTQGLFRYSRNPIYLGFVVCLTGIWLWLGSASPGLVVLVFVMVTNFWYIRYEEKNMEQTFGDDYLLYKKSVRRWL